MIMHLGINSFARHNCIVIIFSLDAIFVVLQCVTVDRRRRLHKSMSFPLLYILLCFIKALDLGLENMQKP